MTKTIQIVGLGGGDIDQLPLGIYKILLSKAVIYLRTSHHPVITSLEEEGITFRSFDNLYEESTSFQDVYEKIVSQLIEIAKTQSDDIIYAVPGHPLVAERTVQLLIERASNEGVYIDILGGQSFIDPVLNTLRIDPIEGFLLLDGTLMSSEDLDLRKHTIISQVYDQLIASEIKITLMETYPDDYTVFILTAAGSSSEKLEKVALFELDRQFTDNNNLAVVYIPPILDEKLLHREFWYLKKIIKTLRSPEGCPWDREQTHESLKKYLIEEAYEVLEAIETQDDEHLTDELGDVLLQVMLHSQIGEEDGYFTIEDVIEALTNKMIRRHPHVFADVEINNTDDVVKNWDEIKQQEKASVTSILDGIPKSLPSLSRAMKLQKKAAKVGFDWDDSTPIWNKVFEELEEFKQAVEQCNKIEMEKEFGDIVFALVNLSRYYKIDPEVATNSTNQKFYCRFLYIEEKLSEQQLNWNDVSLSYLDELWEKAKKIETKEGNQ
jgi:tetrapyrrole methylase family protein/MazG family protein